jgi:adenine-specific DNA-methyltransferase
MPSTGWRWEEDTTKKALAEDPPRIHFGKDHSTIPNRKSYLFEIDEEPMMSVFYKDGRAATLEVEAMLGAGAFQFPKDSEIIGDLISVVAGPGDIVLDSFGGSGTTAHAVLRQNQHLKEPMRFILVEMDEAVAQTKTRERVQKAIDGYIPLTGKKKTPTPGLGGGFQFCTLSPEPLFTPEGQIRPDVTSPNSPNSSGSSKPAAEKSALAARRNSIRRCWASSRAAPSTCSTTASSRTARWPAAMC